MDPESLGKMGEDKIFSNLDTYTGKIKASHYNPPNLFLGMSMAPTSTQKKPVIENPQDKEEPEKSAKVPKNNLFGSVDEGK